MSPDSLATAGPEPDLFKLLMDGLEDLERRAQQRPLDATFMLDLDVVAGLGLTVHHGNHWPDKDVGMTCMERLGVLMDRTQYRSTPKPKPSVVDVALRQLAALEAKPDVDKLQLMTVLTAIYSADTLDRWPSVEVKRDSQRRLVALMDRADIRGEEAQEKFRQNSLRFVSEMLRGSKLPLK
jgi:hypothetical protein